MAETLMYIHVYVHHIVLDIGKHIDTDIVSSHIL